MGDEVEVTQADREAAVRVADLCGWSGTIQHDMLWGTCEAVRHEYKPQVEMIEAFAHHRIASVRAAAMSDLIAGDADMYDTPSARITGDKDRESPVEGAQPAPSDDLVERVARAIWEQQCQHWGHYREKLPDLCAWDDLTQSKQRELMREATAAIAAVGQDTRSQVEREIVAWLRAENGTCDCFAHSSSECACGAWDDYKVKPLCDLADAIEHGQYRSEG